MLLGNNKSYKDYLVLLYSFNIVFYYIFPSIATTCVNLGIFFILLFSRTKYSLISIKWYSLFYLYLLVDFLIRDEKMVYLSSCLNCLLIVVITSKLLTDKNKIRLFLNSSSILGGILCLFLFLKYGHMLGVGRFGNELLGTRISNAVLLGYILLYISVIQLWAYFNANGNKVKILSFIFFLFTIYLITFTGTRKALILPLILFFIMIYYKNKKNFLRLLLYLGGAFLLIILAFLYMKEADLISEEQVERLVGLLGFIDRSVDMDESSLTRQFLATKAIDIFVQYPLLGYGIDNTLRDIHEHPHNNYLSLLAYGGIFMLMIYYWIYLYICCKFRYYCKQDIVLTIIVLLIIPLSDLGTTSFNIIYFNLLVTLLCLHEKNKSSLK